MDLAQLQAQRQQIISEIQRRGGKASAPGFAKRLADVEGQIRQARQSGGAQSGATGDRGFTAAQNPVITKSTDMRSLPQATQVENNQAAFEADKNFQYNNPNQTGPVGSREITRDDNGNVTVKDSLSDGQQKILGQEEAISQMGRELASTRLQNGGFNEAFNPQLNSRAGVQSALDAAGQPFNPQTAQRTHQGDFVADRQRIEDEVFKSLTRNVDRDYGKAREDMEQQLANRGIPIGSKLYNDQMGQVNERFDGLKAQAMGQAVQMGGQEMGRSFDMQEGLIGNQYNQQLGTHGQNFNQAATRYSLNEATIGNQFGQAQGIRNQNLGEISGLSGMGAGLMMPSFQAYQGASFDATNPFDIFLAQQGNKQNQQQINIARQQANRSGGGGGQAAAPPSPFNNTPPPGL